MRAFCRLSKMLYGSSGVGGDTGGAGCEDCDGVLGVTAGPSPGWSAAAMVFSVVVRCNSTYYCSMGVWSED